MNVEVASSSVADDQVSASVAERAEEILTVGQRLRAAREAKGMSIDEIARSLKLSPRQIVALEADDWTSLPCKTIIRGFVRNYARLLGLDADPLMSLLEAIEMPQVPELEIVAGTPVNLSSENKADRRDYFRVFSGLLILALAILVTYFFPKDAWESTVSAFNAALQPNESVVEPAVVEPAATTPEPAPSLVDSAPAPLAEPEAPGEVVTPTEAQSEPEVQADAAATSVLKFSFDQAAWVEVRDRDGAILLSQLNQAGSQRDVEGRPPFALVVGNATHVSVQFKGKPVDLSKRSKDDVARLSVE